MIKVRRLLKKYSYEERITKLNLRPDRADVIIPGADIYLKVVQWAGIKNIFVPVMGLADGVVRTLYDDYKAQAANAQPDETDLRKGGCANRSEYGHN